MSYFVFSTCFIDFAEHLGKISLNEESDSGSGSSDDSDFDMEAIMDYIQNTGMEIDIEPEQGAGATRAGLGMDLDGDSSDDKEERNEEDMYLHVGGATLPHRKRQRRAADTEKVSAIVKRMDQGYEPAVDMAYRQEARKIVEDFREMYLPSQSPFLPLASDVRGGNSKEKRRQRREHEAQVQKYAARAFVRAQDPESMLHSEKTVVVTATMSTTASSSSTTTTTTKVVASVSVAPSSAVSAVSAHNLTRDPVSRSWWPKIVDSVTLVGVDAAVPPCSSSPALPPSMRDISIVAVESPEDESAAGGIEIEESVDEVGAAVPCADPQSADPAEVDKAIDEIEDGDDIVVVDSEMSEESGEESYEEESDSDELSEGEEAAEQEYDYDKMMEESSSDEDNEFSSTSSSENESIIIEFEASQGSSSDSDSADEDLRNKNRKRRSLPGVRRWDEHDDAAENDKAEQEEEEEDKIFKAILRGSFEEQPQLLSSMPLATTRPRCSCPPLLLGWSNCLMHRFLFSLQGEIEFVAPQQRWRVVNAEALAFTEKERQVVEETFSKARI